MLLLVAALYEPLRKLIQIDGLYYGGKMDFYHDTLLSLAKYFFYQPYSNSIIVICLNVFLAVFGGIVLLSFLSGAGKPLFLKNAVLCLLFVCVASILLQHFLLGTFYVIDRAALFLYPLIILCIGFCLDSFSFKKFSVPLALLLCMAFTFNFALRANGYKAALWYFDAHSKAIISSIDAEGRKAGKKVRIDFSWPLQSSFGYYIRKEHFPYVDIDYEKKTAPACPSGRTCSFI
jgi:hypothetical protein